MERLDLAYKLVYLKVKSKEPDQIYFMSQGFKEHTFTTPSPQLFFMAKIFENFS